MTPELLAAVTASPHQGRGIRDQADAQQVKAVAGAIIPRLIGANPSLSCSDAQPDPRGLRTIMVPILDDATANGKLVEFIKAPSGSMVMRFRTELSPFTPRFIRMQKT
eukprot:tig00000459_g1111.t1